MLQATSRIHPVGPQEHRVELRLSVSGCQNHPCPITGSQLTQSRQAFHCDSESPGRRHPCNNESSITSSPAYLSIMARTSCVIRLYSPASTLPVPLINRIVGGGSILDQSLSGFPFYLRSAASLITAQPRWSTPGAGHREHRKTQRLAPTPTSGTVPPTLMSGLGPEQRGPFLVCLDIVAVSGLTRRPGYQLQVTGERDTGIKVYSFVIQFSLVS